MSRVEISMQSWGLAIDSNGNVIPGLGVEIKNLDGTPTPVYSAMIGGTSDSGTHTTNADGTIGGYIEEGAYLMTVAGVFTRRVEAVGAVGPSRILPWTANTFYRMNTIVIDGNGNLQRAVADHVSGASFSQGSWLMVPLPGESISVASGLRGEIVPGEPLLWGLASRALTTAARTWLMRFNPKRTWNVTLAKWDVTTAATTDQSVELAVYNSALSSRLATSGVQAGQLNGLGVKGVGLTYTFDPAVVYYLAFTAPVSLAAGVGATVNGRSDNSNTASTLFGTTVPTALAGFIDGLSSPLPTSITAGSVSWTAVNTFPMLALREV